MIATFTRILRLMVALPVAWPRTLPAQAPVLQLDHVGWIPPSPFTRPTRPMRQISGAPPNWRESVWPWPALSNQQSPGFSDPNQARPCPWFYPPAYYALLRQPMESLATDLSIIPADRAVTSWLERSRTRRLDLFAHALGGQRITRLMIRGPLPQRPDAADLDLRPIQFEEAAEPLLLLELDGGRAGDALWTRTLSPAGEAGALGSRRRQPWRTTVSNRIFGPIGTLGGGIH